MTNTQLLKIIELMKTSNIEFEKLEECLGVIKSAETSIKSLLKTNEQILRLVNGFTDSTAMSNTQAKTKANYEYEYDGVADYANRLVLKTSEVISKEYTFKEHCELVSQQKILKTKNSKLKMFATETEVKNIRKDYKKRYFMKNPLISIDGVKFYVTTQWTTTEIDKDTGERVAGPFERYRTEVVKLGINIKKI